MTISASLVKELREKTGAGMMDCKTALTEVKGDIEAAVDWLRKKGLSKAAKKAGRTAAEGLIGIHTAGNAGAMVEVNSETDFVARNEQFQALVRQLASQVLAKGAERVPEQTLAPGLGSGKGTVAEAITQAIGTTGENLQFMEAAKLEAPGGVVGGYVHSNAKIGVLVALKAEGAAKAEQLEPVARDLAMHIAASQVSAIRPEDVPADVLQKEKEIYGAQAKESGKPADIVEKMVQGRLAKFLKEVSLLNQPFVKNPELTIEKLLAEQSKALGAKLSVERYVKFTF
jgi:elongation factor Ts